MRHGIAGRKLSRTSDHRKALMRNLAKSLINNERLTTTLPKAKELRRFVEPLITLSKKGDLASKRLAMSRLANSASTRQIVDKLFGDLATRYKKRNGGYTRVIKLGPRQGDNAPMALVELVDRNLDIEKNRKAKRDKKRDALAEKSQAE